MGNPEGKRLLGRPERRWENNINMDIKEWDLGVWSGLMCPGQGPVACNCGDGKEPSDSLCGISWLAEEIKIPKDCLPQGVNVSS